MPIYGIFQDHYQTVFDMARSSTITASVISWTGSIQIFLGMTPGIITGPLFDRGFICPLVSIGSFLIVLGMLVTSFVATYAELFLAQSICVGVGIGVIYVPCLAAVSAAFEHEPDRRPIAIGLASLGGSTGGVVLLIMLRSLMSHVGFAWAVRILAFTNLAAAFAVIGVLCWRPGHARRDGRRISDKTALA